MPGDDGLNMRFVDQIEDQQGHQRRKADQDPKEIDLIKTHKIGQVPATRAQPGILAKPSRASDISKAMCTEDSADPRPATFHNRVFAYSGLCYRLTWRI